ncbi:hypothetical protein [Mesobaculum littorinae]|uniref:hypothetical protein n=1 Tax=Mesobaculum littorinae TaxID=2486419 RepID=UPI0026B9823D
MKILIVASELALAQLWSAHLGRVAGAEVRIVDSQDSAIQALQFEDFDAVVLDLGLTRGSPMAVSDFVSYRLPDMPVIPVTPSSFFSDGSVFRHIPNAATSLNSRTPPGDLAAIVAHYAERPVSRADVVMRTASRAAVVMTAGTVCPGVGPGANDRVSRPDDAALPSRVPG